MSGFEPIAIVGRGCMVPGAENPETLLRLVLEKRSALTAPPPPGLWLVDAHRIHGRVIDGSASLVGGYVGDLDPRATLSDLALPERELLPMDVSFHWALAAARQALITIGHESRRAHPRAGLILGNLSYPTRSLALFAESIWRGTPSPVVSGSVAGQRRPESEIDPQTRFMSGLPAHLLARALGLGGPAFALDAACASSLYAVKLACDRLHDRECDLMLAGGVNGTDDLFLHVGFTALGALSPTGRSRPFHREADGLIPSRGAAFVALERLADARAAGHRVFGVIRAVSVANDGRSQGLLVPSREGQVRTMAAAYPLAGLTPAEISLVECHATGTRRGDETEVLAMREVFRDVTTPVSIGSLKGNLGHLITASGAASLIKILGSFERGTLPPTLHADAPLEALTGAPLRLVTEPEPWTVRPRRAAISNFGFGGNNAHLLLEEPDAAEVPHTYRTSRSQRDDDVAVVAVAAIAGGADDFDAFADLVLGRIESRTHQVDAIHLDPTAVRFPPNDLRETLPQQLLVLSAAMQIADVITAQDRARTSVLIGMQSDAEVARVGGRLRATSDPDAFWPSFSLARVLGAMPNVVANRIGSQFDVSGPSYTVSAEEASGLVATELARRALAAGEIDAAVVGAVDLSCEPVHRAAAAAVLGETAEPPGDAAVVMVLKRMEDARRAGDRIHAVLSRRAPADVGLSLGTVADAICLSRRFGHAHAASGLLHLAAAIACCERRRRPEAIEPWLPNRGVWGARVAVAALGGCPVEIFVRADATTVAVPTMFESPPRLEVYSATTRAELIQHVAAAAQDDGRRGPVRLAIASTESDDPARTRARAVDALRQATSPEIIAVLEDGTYFAERPVGGEVALVFTGPAGAYPDMGRDLVQALPQLVDGVQKRFANLREAAGWIYEPVAATNATPEDKLWASSFLAQVHAELTLGVLGIEPQAVLGLCAGESNALFAMGVWDDLTAMYDALRAHGVFTRELAGEFAAVARSRGSHGGNGVDWSAWRLLAPVDTVRDALAAESTVHLAIIQAPDDVVICGDAAACCRVVAAIGETRARRTGYDVAFHCPEARSFAETWRALHRRPVRPHAAARFYSHATCSAYALSSDSIADALTTQAMQTVDFPRLVARAARDGVRIFIEHGQHAGCSKWIDKILANTRHLAVSLDAYGRSSLAQAADTVARLVVAGVPMDVSAFQRALAAVTPARVMRKRGALTIPAHGPPVRVRSAATDTGARSGIAVATLSRDEHDRDEDGELMEAPPTRGVVVVEAPSRRAVDEAVIASPRAVDRVAVPPTPRVRGEAAVSAARSLLASMNAEHRRFLEIQAAAHEEFLDSQARASAVLVGAHGAGAAAWAVTSSVPVETSRASATAPSIDVPDVRIQIAPVRDMRTPRGLRLDRAALEAHASGRVSDAFGPAFRDHDDYVLRVRMPEPPLLLADRVTGLDAEPGSMGLGSVWTETDIRADSWYLHAGRMPAGLLMEAGQADLLLISYLGIDRLNRGERVYRLLGCDFTFHDRLPRAGETLAYDIHVERHAELNGVRLFSFRSDAYAGATRLASWRNAQAGFFSHDELASARGVVWRPEEASPTPGGRLDPPALRTERSSFDRDAVRAFAEGRPHECFGPAFVRTRTHSRTPRIPSDRMLLLDEIEAFDPTGGPWRRGYLRAVMHLDPDRWFFDGHFTNDPCMPGTLMVEMCMQAMAFYLATLGYTATRDGWVFEPTPEETAHLVCRSQVVPESKELACEVFVDEVIDGPEPTLYAAVLGIVDGQPAMHSPRMALSLRPGWPIDDDFELLDKLATHREPTPVAVVDGFEFGYRSLVHGALGKHTDAFGALYAGRDGPGFFGHLPAPPYHFMSRVLRIDGRPGGGEAGIGAAVEYDVPPDAWYFTPENSFAMPFAALLEVAFQPCGWLAFLAGLPLAREDALYFRNLDGRGTFHRVIGPAQGPLLTEARLNSVVTAGGPVLVSFLVSVRLGHEPVLDLETTFGFFDADDLRLQPGLPTSDAQMRALTAGSAHRVEIATGPGHWAGAARIGMLDEVTGLWPDGGAAGLGRARARQRVDPDAWYFKAHFVRDPVQPGALGLQAMFELLEHFAVHRDPRHPVRRPHFETPALGEPVGWKCRGQVLPENKETFVDIDVTRVVADERGLSLVADGSLWVDGTRIYEATGLSTRLSDR